MRTNNDVTTAERQLFILTLLSQTGGGYTAKEILKQLQKNRIECSPRTLNRDLDIISLRFNVYEDEREGQTYYIADKTAVADIAFTIPQMISLYYLKEMLSSAEQTDITRGAKEIIDALLDKMPPLSKEALKDIENMLKIENAHNTSSVIDPNIEETIRKAIQLGVTVEIIYETFHSGEINKRRVDPYVLEIKEGRLHVIGYCHLRKEIRDFRVSRIKKAEITKKTFDKPADFFKNYKKNRFDKLAGGRVCDVEIEFTGEAVRLVSEFHAQKADKIVKDGEKLIFKRRAAVTPDFIQWIMSYGSDAKVIAPDELAVRVHERAASIARLYE